MTKASKFAVHKGIQHPMGLSNNPEGFNFALFSKNATGVKILFFANDLKDPFFEFTFDPKVNKTGWIWHVTIGGLPEHFEYAYRVDGPHLPEKGHLFDPSKLLMDPYAKALNSSCKWGAANQDNIPYQPKGCVFGYKPFDWEKDKPPNIPPNELIIYEMHVRAFTQDPSSKVAHPGTFLSIIEKIPHLKALGVNAIELLPVFEFNECEYKMKNPKTGEMLTNFWGYSTVNYFSPMNRYATNCHDGSAINEFRALVKEMHKNGIEVFLDVVYNHTAELTDKGPYYSFRGIDNTSYYLINESGGYRDFSGCGNTLKCNHPVVADLILDSLRFWVSELHVDGFRFDLASVLSRDEKGIPLNNPPIIESIAHDPVLAGTKLIAEAWDAHGLYQVGQFPQWGKWAEWNGKYRDTVRRFIKGTDGVIGEFTQALCGSENLYRETGSPSYSINFVIAHDGYTLRDLVSYQEKHNELNGENNRDGTNDNESWNCGQEGPSNDPKINTLRQRQMKNFVTALMVSIGTPMIFMGDEYGHTRNGNNNAWCQDNKLNYFLWDELEKNKDHFRFFRSLIDFRKKHPNLSRNTFLKKEDIDWHGFTPFNSDWSSTARFIAYTLKDASKGQDLYIAFNAKSDSAHIILPAPPSNKKWYRIVNTAENSPQDFLDNPKSLEPLKEAIEMQPYSAFIAEAF